MSSLVELEHVRVSTACLEPAKATQRNGSSFGSGTTLVPEGRESGAYQTTSRCLKRSMSVGEAQGDA